RRAACPHALARGRVCVRKRCRCALCAPPSLFDRMAMVSLRPLSAQDRPRHQPVLPPPSHRTTARTRRPRRTETGVAGDGRLLGTRPPQPGGANVGNRPKGRLSNAGTSARGRLMRIAVLGWHGSVHTRRFARFFAEAGHDIHVITCGDGDVTDTGRGDAPPYVVHELGLPAFGKAGYVAKIPTARRLVRSLRPDVLHAHTATSYGPIAAATGIHPLAVTTHGSDVLLSTANPAMRMVVRHVLLQADLITTPAEHMQRRIESLIGARSRDVLVVQYGVETNRLIALGAEVRADR